jgi:hypothetical protein
MGYGSELELQDCCVKSRSDFQSTVAGQIRKVVACSNTYAIFTCIPHIDLATGRLVVLTAADCRTDLVLCIRMPVIHGLSDTLTWK